MLFWPVIVVHYLSIPTSKFLFVLKFLIWLEDCMYCVLSNDLYNVPRLAHIYCWSKACYAFFILLLESAFTSQFFCDVAKVKKSLITAMPSPSLLKRFALYLCKNV